MGRAPYAAAGDHGFNAAAGRRARQIQRGSRAFSLLIKKNRDPALRCFREEPPTSYDEDNRMGQAMLSPLMPRKER